MPYPKFNRSKLLIRSLKERKNQVYLREDLIPLSWRPENLSSEKRIFIERIARKIIFSREKDKPVILAFGAHSIKNGLGSFLTGMIRKGWVTHLATNGAGIIHDWELAFQGCTGENVRENVASGQFGIWDETGKYINLAIITGAFRKLGYGESVGKMISEEGIEIPDPGSLPEIIRSNIEKDPELAAAATDLYDTIIKNRIEPGFMHIPHSFKEYSVQCSAYELKVPFTGHPMIGHDIIYNHPLNHGAAVGRTALTDFLYFSGAVENLEGGVYLSVGSAVMSPMIFEKALSMARNVEIQNGRDITNFLIAVVDLAEYTWDWETGGEPPADNPAYYLRYCKTFNRMGGQMHYLQADNRDFLAELYHILNEYERG